MRTDDGDGGFNAILLLGNAIKYIARYFIAVVGAFLVPPSSPAKQNDSNAKNRHPGDQTQK